ncbi:SAC3 domain-containing protein [Cephalotus follicularis]|uniref:SAC3 domain-containing protein n=1 Tax=Cephalotus follicularis TaxID=3775 RepID=A0A1Q3CT62_CEPFO|nr:SAC3 domain-containing protein [Cephalotus follicularis]
MKQEVSNKKLEQHLQTSQIRENINSLRNNIINNLCSDLPDAFWHRKRHMVSLPYEKDFTKQNILTKARPIQMTYELMKYCKKEIQELLNKKLIRLHKSLWSCATFCVNQGIQRSVINYKTLKIRV